MASTTKYVEGQDEVVIHDEPSAIAPHRVPTADDSEPVATYQDWTPENTRVITCCIGNDVYPGRRFTTRQEAYRAIEREYGRICEANYVPGRAFLRVKR